MEENNNIDDIFRSALENHELEPAEKSWSSLSTDLARKRTARLLLRRIYYFVIPAVILLVSFSAYKYFSGVNTENEKQQNASGISVPQEITNPNSRPAEIKQGKSNQNIGTSESKVNPAVNLSEATLEANNSNDITAIPLSKNESHSASLTADNSNRISEAGKNENNVIEKPKNLSQPALTAAAATTAVKTSSESKTNNEDFSNAENSGSLENPAEVNENVTSNEENQIADSKIETNNPVETENINNNSAVPAESKAIAAGVILEENNAANTNQNAAQNNTAATPLPAQSAQPDQIAQPDQLNQTNQVNGAQPVQTAPPVQAAQSNQAEEKISDFQPTQKPDSSPSLLKKIYSHISIGAFYSPEYIKQHLTVNDSYTGLASKNIDDYDDASSEYSYSTGFNLNYDIGKKWNIGSGVSFSSYSISSVYNSISVISDSVYQEEYVNGHGHGNGHHGHGHGHNQGHGHHQPPNHHNNHHYIVHTPCGDIDLTNEPPQGSTSQEGDTLNVKTEVFETVHFISVPLFVQYKFGQKKLSYFIEGGGSINFVNKDRVKVIVNDSYTEDNNLNSLSSYNYSLELGLGAQYNIYKGLSMYLKPSMRYSITPVNLDSPVNSYPYFFGLGAGITFHF